MKDLECRLSRLNWMRLRHGDNCLGECEAVRISMIWAHLNVRGGILLVTSLCFRPTW